MPRFKLRNRAVLSEVPFALHFRKPIITNGGIYDT